MDKRPDWELATWHKSNRSGDGNCVEMAQLGGWIGLRDSKDPQGPVLSFTPAEWSAFLGGVSDGDFGIVSV